MVVYVTTAELGQKLRAAGDTRRAVDMAIKNSIAKWTTWLPLFVDSLGITDTGGYRDGFKITTTSGKVAAYNSHPAAGVIENGCAPHPVSMEGQENIERWCARKLHLPPEEAKRAAFLICRKIREHGQPAQFVVKRALRRLYAIFTVELAIALRKEHAR